MTVVVGLLGGVASGKSTVASVFADLGAEVVDGDVLAREALGTPEVRAAVSARFGPDVYDSGGAVRASVLAERAFRGTEADARALEDIVHPPVLRRVEARLAGAGAGAVLVLDLPLLLEKGLGDRCDVLVYVDAPAALRRQRARSRGWAGDEADLREGRQAPLARKRRVSKIVIKNDKGLDALEKNARMIFVAEIQTLLSPDTQ
jgi:dephospho-CoA kinase